MITKIDPQPTSNSSGTRPKWLYRLLSISMIAGLAICAWAAWQYSQSHAKNPLHGKPHDSDIKAVYVTTSEVITQPVERTVDVVGTVEAYEAISIRAKVEGQIKRLIYDVADRVEPMAALLEIDSTDYDLAVRQAERSLQVELSRLGLTAVPDPGFDVTSLPTVKQAQSKLEFSRSNAQRLQSIISSKAISEQELESARTEFRWAEAEYENQLLVAKSNLATVWLRAEALAIARQKQQDTIVRAPNPQHAVPHQSDPRVYAVSARSVSEGTYVRPGDELVRLVIDATLRLRAFVPERFLGQVQPGQNAHISIAAKPTAITGKVVRINPVIDPATRSFEVEIQIANSDSSLKPGGFAKAAIVVDENASAAIVPLEAVVSFAGVTKIFRIQNDIAHEVQVKVGLQGTHWVEITDPPLDVGTEIVTSGQTNLADKTPVVRRVVAQPGSSEVAR